MSIPNAIWCYSWRRTNVAARNYGREVQRDLRNLLVFTLCKVVVDQWGNQRLDQPTQRLAIPYPCWRKIFSLDNAAVDTFAATCFAVSREIYLVQDIASEEPQQDGGTQAAECSGNISSAIPDSVKARWREQGWSFDYQQHTLRIIKPDSTSVHIRDIYHTSLVGMDLSALPASEVTSGNRFQRQAPPTTIVSNPSTPQVPRFALGESAKLYGGYSRGPPIK
ncbi:hypothetical protein E8E14_010513 [Neopestalotiopsis sp. 37M]|nr:hypothetical protein E8E14_010513 [Neopestalotiopsis sp. 37M]